MTDRDRLIELISQAKDKTPCSYNPDIDCEGIVCSACENGSIADYLLANGVIVTPCIAMVEQFIKDGKLDKKCAAHNGRTAVVYVDKSKWNAPLIDITEQFYNTDKAVERIKALEGMKNG